MPWFGHNGRPATQRRAKTLSPREISGTIGRLTSSFRELSDKRDRLESDVERFRRRVAEADAELNQLHSKRLELSWRPAQVERQRLELYRDKVRAHLDTVKSELDKANADLAETRAVLVRQYAVAQASRHPAEALTMPCPVCGQPSVPQQTGAGGRGWRKGWYECSADECDTAWSVRWSRGVFPVVRVVGF
jgi:DNA repair exonuclease SbcCD ATPase subunit